METNLSLFCFSSLGGGGRGLDPICTMSRYLPFLSFDGSPNRFSHNLKLAHTHTSCLLELDISEQLTRTFEEIVIHYSTFEI